MKSELEKQLVKDFPFCFGDYGKDMKQTSIYWGCQCNDGWEPIIREACAKAELVISNWVEKHKHDEDFNIDFAPRLSQVKEKYGTLRMDFTTYPEGIDEIEMAAEKKSETTCETCGEPGKLRGQGWYYVSCIDHSEEKDLDSLEIVEEAYIKNKKEN